MTYKLGHQYGFLKPDSGISEIINVLLYRINFYCFYFRTGFFLSMKIIFDRRISDVHDRLQLSFQLTDASIYFVTAIHIGREMNCALL